MNAALKPFDFPLRVYIEDTDAGGIVYYVNYLKFMERGRTELVRSLGFDKPALPQDDIQLVVHSAQVNYRQPAKLDDSLNVLTHITKLSRASLVFQQEVLRAEELMCEASIKVACVNAKTLKPMALPLTLYSALARYINH
mgnify:CR=1 FL=1